MVVRLVQKLLFDTFCWILFSGWVLGLYFQEPRRSLLLSCLNHFLF